jgi:putative endonuclease
MGLTQLLGNAAEQQARDYLCQQGLRYVESNWRAQFFKQAGELDLVMREGDDWVFVEVRARKSGHFGGAAASVTYAKQQKLRRAAQAYLQAHQLHHAFCRFDVVAIESGQINWIQNAF